jgi:hypothetical protein
MISIADMQTAERDDRENRLAAESTLDQILADSFPASDPPSWTLGIARPASDGANRQVGAADVATVRENVIDVSRHTLGGRTLIRGLVSLTGAAGIILLVPIAILIIGLPVALVVRLLVEAVPWLFTLLFS